MPQLTEIYRSNNKEGAYLYVPKGTDLSTLPAALMRVFGRGELAMTLLLTADKQLATTTGEVVLNAIAEQGFYLQLPPRGDSQMAQLAAQNSKLVGK